MSGEDPVTDWDRGVVGASTVRAILAEEVLSRCAEHHIRQRDLALAAGISEKHLSQMLTGKVNGALSMWDRLLAELPAPAAVPDRAAPTEARPDTADTGTTSGDETGGAK